MLVPTSDAGGRLTERVRRAEAGEEIVLTRHGHPAATKVSAGPNAVRGQDLLQDESGVPR